MLDSSGNSERILGYSPSTNKLVVRRPPEEKPTSSASSSAVAKRNSISPPPPRERATSVRVRDLTSTEVEICGSCGVHVISFIDRRYLSVAKKVILSPSISILTAV